jgi:menaquinone-dependent protoporphyrinogen oxidase
MKNGPNSSPLGQEPHPKVLVLYATTNGQTRRIAERIASTLRERGISSDAFDVESAEASSIDWKEVDGVLLGASLYRGKYQGRAVEFTRTHIVAMSALPSAFFGVSLSAASRNPEEVETALELARGFAESAGWKPTSIASFAGALAYTRYGFLIRFIMKRIARKEGAPTDTSRDYELTNWAEVERFANEMAETVLEVGRASSRAAQPETWTPSQLPTA